MRPALLTALIANRIAEACKRAKAEYVEVLQ